MCDTQQVCSDSMTGNGMLRIRFHPVGIQHIPAQIKIHIIMFQHKKQTMEMVIQAQHVVQEVLTGVNATKLTILASNPARLL